MQTPVRSLVKNLLYVAALLVIACGSGTAAASSPSPVSSPTLTADEQACSELSTFKSAYDASAAIWSKKANEALHRVDYYGPAGNLARWHIAWTDEAADLNGYAAALNNVPVPAAIADAVSAVHSSLIDLGRLASIFSRASFAYWNSHDSTWSAARGAQDGAVTGMSFRLGLQQGLHSCV